MKFHNLTPHEITIVDASSNEKTVASIKASGTVARCTELQTIIGVTRDGVPLYVKTFGDLIGLPEPAAGVMYICSALAASQAWSDGRIDVACPGNPVRDEQGRIVGCRGLCLNPSIISAETIYNQKEDDSDECQK